MSGRGDNHTNKIHLKDPTQSRAFESWLLKSKKREVELFSFLEIKTCVKNGEH